MPQSGGSKRQASIQHCSKGAQEARPHSRRHHRPAAGSASSSDDEDRSIEPRMLEIADQHGASKLHPAMRRERMGNDPKDEFRLDAACLAGGMNDKRTVKAPVVGSG